MNSCDREASTLEVEFGDRKSPLESPRKVIDTERILCQDKEKIMPARNLIKER